MKYKVENVRYLGEELFSTIYLSTKKSEEEK